MFTMTSSDQFEDKNILVLGWAASGKTMLINNIRQQEAIIFDDFNTNEHKEKLQNIMNDKKEFKQQKQIIVASQSVGYLPKNISFDYIFVLGNQPSQHIMDYLSKRIKVNTVIHKKDLPTIFKQLAPFEAQVFEVEDDAITIPFKYKANYSNPNSFSAENKIQCSM